MSAIVPSGAHQTARSRHAPKGSGPKLEYLSVALRGQFKVVLAWIPLLLGTVVLSAAAAFVVTGFQPKVYESTTTLIVGQSLTGTSPDVNQLQASASLAATYSQVATTQTVLARVITKLGLTETPTELAKRVTAAAAPGSTLLTITAKDNDPVRAATLANALAAEIITPLQSQDPSNGVDVSIEQDLAAIRSEISDAQAEIEVLRNTSPRTDAQETRFQTLQGNLVSLRASYATLLGFAPGSASNALTVVQPAVPPDGPSSPRPILNALLGALIGFFVASLIAFVSTSLDDSIKEPEQAADAVGVPTLGAIPRIKVGKDKRAAYKLATLRYPRSPAAEAYRAIRTNIEFASIDAPIKTLLVTSAMPAEGKTVTAANLGVVFAQGGRRVLLIDADLRKPGAHEIFGLPNVHGLTTLLGTDAVRADAIVQPTAQVNLDVLSPGTLPPNPADLLGSQRMKTVLATLARSYDLLIFDSPALEVLSDSAVISSYVDGTILVVDAGHSRKEPVRRAREALSRANAKMIGVVFNGFSEQPSADYERYYGAGSELTSGTQIDSIRPA